MANKNLFVLIATVYWAIMGLQAWAITDELEVQALQDLYRSLNSPMQLKHWKSEGGDPCGEPWAGVQCIESSIMNLKLHGLGLNGNLGSQLSNLKSLKHLDLSSNNIGGSIPYGLPPNLTNLNIAENRFTQSLSFSFENLKHLRHLNLSHNILTGPLGDVFNGLENLKLLDLSFNNFTGDLPTSFESLTNLTGLFLQNNQFTGSVIFLANLSLSTLNIEDNHFSGVIPEHFQTIHNLRIGGNKFHTGPNYPPWKFPSDVMPTEKNISSPPLTNLSAYESHPSQITGAHKKKTSHAASIVPLIGGVTMIAALAALAIIYHRKWAHKKILRSPEGSDQESMQSLPIGKVHGVDYTSMNSHNSPHMSSLSSSPMITPSRLPPIRTKTLRVTKRKSFTKIKMPICAKAFTVEELQLATNSFSEDNLIGEGSLGSVYRAEFPDGTILAVKNIKTVPLSITEEQQFFDVIKYVSRLRHPNVVTLAGFCMEHGQHLIVYQYIRSLSLDEALHCVAYTPLSWGLRLRIALGIARALDYVHSSFVPPVAHSNLKAANILLDEDLMPHVCDCGLASLRPLSSNSVKIKASEMAIADSGYIAPEHIHPGNGNTKADVYAFGVLLLELLTGRKPFDRFKTKIRAIVGEMGFVQASRQLVFRADG
ncbi:hypothetical protein CASFOL_025414 [Castilleja foliolosa]|uniref:Protein kinase domain-containing protein n=1 Tax=Castilleja foliolosa TaxID=1961234 RepID=A0ABD3CR22_9LAMI